MNRLFVNSHKKGNVILITIAIIFALILLLVSFLKSTNSRLHTTKKLSNVMVAREFASSLAILFNNYVKVTELKTPDSELIKALSKAYDDMPNDKIIDLTETFKNFIKANVNNGSDDILTLLEKGSGLNELKWTIAWCVKKDDFETIKIGDSQEATYPREKTGVIRYIISISHLMPGSKSPVTEDYVFVSSINVVANIFPVLSKFNFYIENALDGDEPTDENTFRFNVIDTMASGDLNNGVTIRPWVLNNGQNSDSVKNTYDDLVNDPRGFVYIGGGSKDKPILLGIARGWADTGFGKYGEDFHFFKNENKKAGYWKTLDLWNPNERIGIMTSNIGMCNDISDDNLMSWQEQFSGLYTEMSKYHSIFKLYGTDSRKSPTMVLGFVDSVCDSVRMMKKGADEVYFLGYIEDKTDYDLGLGMSVDGVEDVTSYQIRPVADAYFDHFGSDLTFEKYNTELATRLLSARYNNDYTYILTNNMVDYPIGKKRVTDLKLIAICDNKNETILNEVPFSKTAKYNEIFGNDLTRLDIFLNKDKLFINGSSESGKDTRLLLSTQIKTKEENKEILTKLGFLNNGQLDLNGFVYLDNEEGSEFEIDKCKVVRNGGIILSQGDIRIKGDIESVNNAHLSILALNGNITIDRAVQNIHSSLITANGQVRVEGDAKDSELNITGNIVMKKVARGNLRTDNSICVKRGLNLTYKDSLSAIPFNAHPEEERSEQSLLMYSLKDDLKMLD